MNRSHIVRRVAVLCVCVVMTLSAATAEEVCVQLDYDLFGHLTNSGNNCAPTATVNSFRYLEQRYPGVYDNNLTGGDLAGSRDTLAEGMNPTGEGTLPRDWWEEKIAYIEQRVPNKTVYKGMLDEEVDPGFDPAVWDRGDRIDYAAPTFDWLFDELVHGEDVEIGIYWGEDAGHALTLTSLCFDDSEGGGEYDNSRWDPGVEDARIDYLDPNAPGGLIWADLALNGDGRLEFTWDNGGNPAQTVWIGLAYSESPVPLPGSMTLILIGLALSPALKSKHTATRRSGR